MPQSTPWLLEPLERAMAWSSVSAVSTPKMTGTPVWIPTFIRPEVTDSEMTSKCVVSPLMSTPTGMMTSTVPDSARYLSRASHAQSRLRAARALGM